MRGKGGHRLGEATKEHGGSRTLLTSVKVDGSRDIRLGKGVQGNNTSTLYLLLINADSVLLASMSRTKVT